MRNGVAIQTSNYDRDNVFELPLPSLIVLGGLRLQVCRRGVISGCMVKVTRLLQITNGGIS